MNKLPSHKFRMFCQKHNERMVYLKKYNGYVCRHDNCAVVFIVNLGALK